VDNQNFRNMILAGVLTLLVFVGWDWSMRHFYPEANKPPVAAASAPAPEASASAKPTREGGLLSDSDRVLEAKDLSAALNPAGRLPIDAPGLAGSINLTGAMVDDLTLRRHTADIDQSKGPQRIFSPKGTPAQQFAYLGWAATGIELPGESTVWQVVQGSKLTPQTPVTLAWANPTGQRFTITYKIDADYLITAEAAVANGGTAPVAIQPYALVNRTDKTAAVNAWNLHSGPFGAFDDKVSFAYKYSDVLEKQRIINEGKPDWIGFTDIYWMSAVVPDKDAAASEYRSLGNNLYSAGFSYAQANLAPGQQVSHSTRIFAGAKEAAVLDRYEAAGIPRFGLAIDWGWFRWFEKPIFGLLKFLFGMSGNFGVAIILLTLIVRGVMFPVAQRQFASMAAMRAIQPKMKALQERYKDDRAKQQEEIMALYKKEGVNPLAGCLPIFLQIPVFFALYKVLILSVEMRHQPFALWIKDLSAPDPLHILNLFGLLPFTPPAFLGIGLLALLLGITMYFQFKLNPAQMDPAQQQVFAIMPWMMMFIMAPFAAGLLIYWITSNCLTMAQQAFLYSRHPQLKAQADKASEDAKRAKARDR